MYRRNLMHGLNPLLLFFIICGSAANSVAPIGVTSLYQIGSITDSASDAQVMSTLCRVCTR